MNRDYIISSIIIVLTVFSLIVFIPKHKIRKALVSFLIAQLLGWPLSIILTILDMRKFPVRFFSKATESNFLLAYMLYTSLFAIYEVNYPNSKSFLIRSIYFTVFTFSVSILDLIIASYTNLLEFKNWSFFWSLIVLVSLTFIEHRYVVWFFRKLEDSRKKEQV